MYMEDKITLMVQSAHTLFCYFNANTHKKDKVMPGSNFNLFLKVYSVENGIEKEIKTIEIKDNADNWYINLDLDDMDVFVRLLEKNSDNTYHTIGISNVVTTPRNYPSSDRNVYYLNIPNKIMELNTDKNIHPSSADFFDSYFYELNKNNETVTSWGNYGR
ncbi:DUF4912 domain-containing protein [Clostridium sp. JN-9]|nr:DUF4912 domain-containing protein [Clostridium sp. JN-9]